MRPHALLCLLLLPAVGYAQQSEEVKLEIKGDIEIVKVDRVIVIKEDREVAKKFPFDVLGPKDADGYWWTVPPGVTANDKGDVLQVTSAPNGELLIKIKVQTIAFDIDFEKKTVKKKTTFSFGSRTIFIGAVPPPKPPTPPTPVSPLTKSLQAAYDADRDPEKADKIGPLAEVMEKIVPASQASGKIKVEKDLQTIVKSATDLAIGPAAIPTVRAAVGTYLVPILGTNPALPANDAFWAKASSEYGYVSIALKGVVVR